MLTMTVFFPGRGLLSKLLLSDFRQTGKRSENYNSKTLDYGILAALVFLVIAIAVLVFVLWMDKRNP